MGWEANPQPLSYESRYSLPLDNCRVRLSAETERSAMLVSEVSRLKEQVTSRDRAVIEVNDELECVRQQMSLLNSNYQTAVQQSQLAQHALYDPHVDLQQ